MLGTLLMCGVLAFAVELFAMLNMDCIAAIWPGSSTDYLDSMLVGIVVVPLVVLITLARHRAELVGTAQTPEGDPAGRMRWAYACGLGFIAVLCLVCAVDSAVHAKESRTVGHVLKAAGQQPVLCWMISRDCLNILSAETPEDRAMLASRIEKNLDTWDSEALSLVPAFRDWTGDAAPSPGEGLPTGERLTGYGGVESLRTTLARHARRVAALAREGAPVEEIQPDVRAFRSEDQRLRGNLQAGIDWLSDRVDTMHTEAQQREWLRLVLCAAVVSLVGLGVMEPAVRRVSRIYRAVAAQAADFERLSLVARRTNNAAIVTDERRRIVWVNDAFTRVTGYTLDEVRGKVPGEFLQYSKTNPETVRVMREALTRGHGCHVEILNRGKNGNEYWLDLDIQPLHDETGRVSGFIAIEVDITENVELRNRLASTFRAMAEGVVVQDTCGRIIDCNPAAERILDRSKEELTGLQSTDPTWRAVRGDGSDYPAHDHPAIRTLRTGESCHDQVMGIHTPGGERRWVSINTQAVRSADGAIASVVSSFADITLRRAQEERLDLVVSGAGLGTWDWDIPSGRVEFNDRWATMLGYEPSEIERHVRTWEKLAHPDDLPHAMKALEAHFRGETPDYRCEHRLKRKDGTWAWVLDAGRVAERDSSGAVLRASGIHIDISGSKNLERSLEKALEEARAATRAKSEFLANMSHEIRTPMTAILGFTDLLHDDGDRDRAPDRRLQYIETIRRNGEHLLTIINDILDVAKIEAGKLTVERIACSPVQLVEDVVSLMRVRAAGKNITLDTVYETEIPELISSDPTRIKQILINLVGNAVKFTELGGVTLRVALERFEDAGARLRFEVADTGMGMSDEQRGRLFGSFSQADASVTRRFGGTGLGLQISRRLAEMLGGDITVVSRPGAGSTFTATVDVGDLDGVKFIDQVTAGKFKTPERAASSETVSLEGVRILLAEDGPDNQRLISHHLKKAGATVQVAENGMAGIRAVTENGGLEGRLRTPFPFDIVLTDMQMPEMDGYTMTRILRSMGCIAPIVALTAHAMSGDQERCIAAGCDGYATKPIDRIELLRTCRDAIAARSSLRAA